MANLEFPDTDTPSTDGSHLTEDGSLDEGGFNNIVNMPKRIKLLKTCSMFLVFFGLGIGIGILSPTTVDMSELYNCTIQQFVSVTSIKPIGILTGSLTGALSGDTSRADIPMFVFTMLHGITLAGFPFSPNLWVMGVLMFVNGLCVGSLNITCNLLNLTLWGESAPTPLHLLHMCITLGMAISPPITIPFLSTDSRNEDTCVNTTSSNTTTSYSGHVKIPYAIFGLWSMAVSLVFMFFALQGSKYNVKKSNDNKKSFRDKFKLTLIAGGDLTYAIYFIISLFLLYFCVNGRDRAMSMFLFIIAHTDVLQLSKPMSAGLVTAGIISVTIGRALAGLLSRWLNIKILLLVQLVIGCYIQMLLFFYGLKSTQMLWILTCLFGLVTGPTYSSILGWANRYIEVSPLVLLVIDIGVGTGACVSLVFNGHLYDTYGSLGVFSLQFVYGVVLLLIFVPLQIVAFFKGDRHKNTTSPVYVINGLSNEMDNIMDDNDDNHFS